MTNPFENPDGRYLVLVNGLGEHSLWPESSPVPAGWSKVHGVADRRSCLDFVERNWTAPVIGRAGG
jgi:MbtH protein